VPSDGVDTPRTRGPGEAAARWRREDGNALLLMPVGVLILLILGAIAVDFAVIYTAQREVANLTAGLANDAAGAVDEDAFFTTGDFRIDRGRAQRVVRQVVATRPDDTLRVSCPTVVLEQADVIRVGCVGTIDLVFSQALPGGISPYTVRASSTARAAEN
jgi:hypothetical protein